MNHRKPFSYLGAVFIWIIVLVIGWTAISVSVPAQAAETRYEGLGVIKWPGSANSRIPVKAGDTFPTDNVVVIKSIAWLEFNPTKNRWEAEIHLKYQKNFQEGAAVCRREIDTVIKLWTPEGANFLSGNLDQSGESRKLNVVSGPEGDCRSDFLIGGLDPWTAVEKGPGSRIGFTGDVIEINQNGVGLIAQLLVSEGSSSTNRPPVINSLTASKNNPQVGEQVNIAVNATDPDGDSLFYKWWLGGSLTSASTPSVNFTPPESGTFSLKVEVSDGNGGTDEAEIFITTEDCPTASSVSSQALPQQSSCPEELSVDLSMDPTNPDLGEVITFTTQVQGAENISQVNYEWFVNGDAQGANLPSVEMDAVAGSWTVQVTVTEGPRQASDSISFSVGVEELNVSLSMSPTNPKPTDTVNFTATVTGGVGNIQYTWTLDGIGQNATGNSVSWSNASLGSHTISVQVQDSDGNIDSDSITFLVGDLEKDYIEITTGDGQKIKVPAGEAVEIKWGGETFQVSAKCISELGFHGADLFSVAFELNVIAEQAFIASVDFVTVICAKVLQNLGIQAPSNVFPQQAFEEYLNVELPKGDFEFETLFEGLNLNVETDSTNIFVMDQNKFTVDHGSDTTIEVQQGQVEVDPKNSSFNNTHINAGQAIDVGNNTMSPVRTISSDPAPSPFPGGSIAEALDTNNNSVLDESEVRAAIQMWILGETVPGTGQTISDPQMREFISMWILGTPVSQNTRAETLSTSLQVRSLALKVPDPMQQILSAHGQNIASMQIQVFDLNGKLQLSQYNVGSQLRFSMLNESSQPLANGVYLYTVMIQGVDGSTWRSGIRKLTVLR